MSSLQGIDNNNKELFNNKDESYIEIDKKLQQIFWFAEKTHSLSPFAKEVKALHWLPRLKRLVLSADDARLRRAQISLKPCATA